MKEKGDKPDLIFIASGSEVSITLEAAKRLEAEGLSVRVVSMFSMYLFDHQDDEYKNSILPPDVKKRIAVEAGVDPIWYKYIGLEGKPICINRLGISGKAEDVGEFFGFNADNIYKTAKELV